jgi:hypothetical protein
MRTVGKFVDVYKQAREYLYTNGVDVSHIPQDPVVRLESDGQWIIESKLEPQQETVVEVSLDDFQSYFYYSFEDKSYIPTDSDVADFVDYVNTNAATE